MAAPASPFHPAEGPLVLTSVKRRRLEMYPLLKQEVDQLKGGYTSPALALLGIFLGAAIAFAVTVATVSLPAPMDRKFTDFAYLSFGLAIICTVRCISDWIKANKIVSNIEKETVEISVIQEPKQE
jgi:uncharacterized membrane protein YjfL (UPF0719 family)